jgi:DNA-binding LytR/AlgR family response regulator
MIRALLVDDEPVARRGLRALLEPHRDITVVGECRNGLEARSAFANLRPELVFLDVKMPDLDGFGALATSTDTPPAVVFVTAFEEHARRAFDVDAVDYLLKPFDRVASSSRSHAPSIASEAASETPATDACSSGTADDCWASRSTRSLTSCRAATTLGFTP